MNTDRVDFDWNAWYASIPGIPGDWGLSGATADQTGRVQRYGRVMVRLPNPRPPAPTFY